MGKYMRKAKTTGELAVVDLSLGVRTRAKTLALQRQARLPAAPPPPAQAQAQAQPAQQPPSPQGAGYLQLRSRRLRKPPILADYSSSRRQRHAQNKDAQQEQKQQNPARNSKAGSRAARVDPESKGSSGREEETGNGESKEEEIEENNCDDEDNNGGGGGGGNEEMEIDDNNEGKDLGLEASFGDNVLDIEDRERSTRESTPCSLIRDPESVQTPGSTTRPTSSAEANRRLQTSMRRHIPTALEMDQFFAGAEEEQQKRFIEKYNFDPVNEKPLPGRYEWEKVDH